MKPVTQVFSTKIADYVLRFATSVIIARYLGPADKGILTFATLVVTWTATFGNFSLTDATIYLVGKGAFAPDQAVGVTALISLLAGGTYMLLLFALLHSGLVHWAEGNPQVFYLLLILIPIQLLVANLTSVIQGMNRFAIYNFLTLMRSSITLVAVALAVWLAESRLLGITQAMIWSAVAGAVVLMACAAKLVLWRPRISLKFLKEALRFGVRGHISVILDNINLRFDQLVLGALIKPVELGWYSTAVSICEMPQLLPDSIGLVLYPRVAGDEASGRLLTARACRVSLLLMIVAVIVLLSVATPFIRLVYGVAYLPTVKAIFFLAPSIAFLSVSKILTKYIYGAGRPLWGVWPTVLSSTVTLCLIFPMVRRYGMLGAAATSTIAYSVGAACNLFLTVKLSTTRASTFLIPQKTDFQFMRRGNK
jgi:O-antigen/teichoic acid export membrane protein